MFNTTLSMTTTLARFSRRDASGSVAVEMAIVLPVLLLCLVLPLFFARIFWYYSVAEKAAHDGARFLSSATQVEMKTQASGGAEAPVASLVRSIVDAELTDIKPFLDSWSVDVQCDLGQCGFAVPQVVRVRVRARLSDNVFGSITDAMYQVEGEGLPLTADLTMRYVGN